MPMAAADGVARKEFLSDPGPAVGDNRIDFQPASRRPESRADSRGRKRDLADGRATAQKRDYADGGVPCGRAGGGLGHGRHAATRISWAMVGDGIGSGDAGELFAGGSRNSHENKKSPSARSQLLHRAGADSL